MLNIVFVANRAYFDKMLITIYSIIKNNKQEFCFFVFHPDIDHQLIDKANSTLSKFYCKIVSIKVDTAMFCGENIMRGDNTYSAYIKTLIPLYMPNEIKTFLYLDCDLLVLKDISHLLNLKPNTSISATRDHFCTNHNKRYFAKSNIPTTNYFNSGVMLFSLKTFSKHEYKIRVESIFQSSIKNYKFHDQDILNMLFSNDYSEIPDSYNSFASFTSFSSVFSYSTKGTYILHYCNLKPWNSNYLGKHKHLYHKYYTEASIFWDKSFSFYKRNNVFGVINSAFKKLCSLFKK